MKKRKKNPIPTSKIVKKALISLLVIITLELILLLLGVINKNIAFYTWIYLIIPIKSMIFVIAQIFSFKIGNYAISLYYIILFLAMVSIIIHEPLTRSKKIKKKKRTIISNIIKIFLIVVLFIEFGVHIGIELMAYNNPNIDTIYLKKETKNKYTKEDLFEFLKKIEDGIIDISSKLERDKKGNIILNDKIENIAVKDMKHASERYEILNGLYPKRYIKYDKSIINKSSTTYGKTSLDIIKINYNQQPPQLLNTITHELCHTRGISKENEAVLCSVMVGIESENIISKYGAYLESYRRTLDAVDKIDSSITTSSEDRISKLCMDNNYQEICSLYENETDEYVLDSQEVEIGTYNTSYYNKEYLEELIKDLKPYKPIYYLDEEIVDDEELLSMIKENQHLVIKVENKEKNFDKLQKVLEKYNDKLQYVSQLSPNDYKTPDLTEEEAEKFYTEKVPDSDVIEHVEGKTELTFDYSRSVRLIMEYFDHENL